MQFGFYRTWTPQGIGKYMILADEIELSTLLVISAFENDILQHSRYKPGQVSLEKDLILPYVPNVDLCDTKCLLESESKRTTLLFFRGRLKRNAVRACQ